jgi:parallel beta-helix repeat protein
MAKGKTSAMLLTLILISVFSLALKIQPVQGATLTVPGDSPTIQGAIYMAYSGDTIRVLAGTYNETLFVNNRVKIIGENKTSTIIDGGGLGTVILITVNSVTVSGFTIRNSAPGWPNSGIVIDKANGCNISDNILENNDHGILLNYTQNSYIANNDLTNNWAGVELFNSSSSTIRNNNATNNEFGIWVYLSNNNALSDNTATNNVYGLWLFNSKNNTLLNNHMSLNTYNFGVWGSDITHYTHGINTSNLVDNKPIYYWVNHHEAEVPSDAGYVALVNSTQITVSNLTLEKNGQGILLAYTENSSIINNSLVNNRAGIELFSSQNNTITNNNATENMYGITQSESSSNFLLNNKVTSNQYGIKLTDSNDNVIHSNAFINNTLQIIISQSTNIWDNGYPSGGNYWSDYTGVDLKSGPNQDQPGSDGIDDAPRIIDVNNTDRYPPMNPITIHDVAVNLTTPRTILGQGYNLLINVQATNKGNRIESANITVLVNTTVITTQIINLTIGTTALAQAWNATGFTRGNYTMSVDIEPVPGETDTADNSFTYNNAITVTVAGDTNGDGNINIYDIVRLAWAYDAKKGDSRFNPNCDIDGNDKINIFDVVIATSGYGYNE